MGDKKIKLYNFDTLDERIDYLKNNSNFLDKYDEIVDLIDDYYDNIYIVLSNGDFFINDELIDHNISFIHMQNTFQLYAISKDNRVLPLNNFSSKLGQYISNGGIPYKSIISTVLSLVCLTEDGFIRFISSTPDLCVDYNNLVDITHIDYIKEDDIIIVSHDGKNFEGLFIE